MRSSDSAHAAANPDLGPQILSTWMWNFIALSSLPFFWTWMNSGRARMSRPSGSSARREWPMARTQFETLGREGCKGGVRGEAPVLRGLVLIAAAPGPDPIAAHRVDADPREAWHDALADALHQRLRHHLHAAGRADLWGWLGRDGKRCCVGQERRRAALGSRVPLLLLSLHSTAMQSQQSRTRTCISTLLGVMGQPSGCLAM